MWILVGISFAIIILVYRFFIKQKKIKKVLNKIESFYLFFNNKYISHSDREFLKQEYLSVFNDSILIMFTSKYIRDFVNDYKHLIKYCNLHNKQYIEEELLKNKDFFDNINKKSLDLRQREAIIIDDDYNLIVAGAGSGKSLTMIGKIKYLVEKHNVEPSKILCLSFTKAAVNSIKSKCDIDGVDFSTFHKLGKQIISFGTDQVFTISEYDLDSIVNDFFAKEVINDNEMKENIVKYFGYYFCIPTNKDFECLGDKYQIEKGFDFETMKSKSERHYYGEKISTMNGEVVRSYEELMIANFLFLNSIDYEYEKLYDKSPNPYKPDFYLTKYDIYFEHFGIDENKRAPWLSENEEKKYIEGIKYKRELHKKNHTKLIETYSYYNRNGGFIEQLQKLMEDNNIEMKRRNIDSIYEAMISQVNNQYYEEFKSTIKKFILLFKSNNFSENKFKEFQKKARYKKNKFIKNREQIFLKITHDIYVLYQDYLKENNKIDFDDMLNLATKKLQSISLPEFLKYDYIIIDEYQDTSFSRYSLINALLEKRKSKLICVGDDFQSIYRFAGCDLNLFINFKDYFPNPSISFIDNTYRNSQELIDVAGQFVMKNPRQITKKINSSYHLNQPISIYYYSNVGEQKRANESITSTFSDKLANEVKTLQIIIDDLVKYRSAEGIYLLGRNRRDIDLILDSKILTKDSIRDGFIYFSYSKYPNLKIKYSTIHIAKGLEDENVIILNMRNAPAGFPNKMSDDPVLDYVTFGDDEYPYEEERRLFYVALTRTKKTVNLLVPIDKKSLFVQELLKDYPNSISIRTGNKIEENQILCPRCKTGKLVVRESSNRSFVGCDNYPRCDYTLNNADIYNDNYKCPSCEGYFTKRQRKSDGKYFYGCSNYPYCKQTMEIKAEPVYIEQKTNQNIKKNDIVKFNDNVSFSKLEKTKMLKQWRLSLSKNQNVPAYVILNDETIEQLASKKISQYCELMTIVGIGPYKFNKYGRQLFNIITYGNSKNVEELIDYNDSVSCLFSDDNQIETYTIKNNYDSFKPVSGGAYLQTNKRIDINDDDTNNNEIGGESPLAKALMCKAEGDVVQYNVRDKKITLKIIKIVKHI